MIHVLLRIFCVGEDAGEDENLTSRNAGLNLLELSLEHLGLDIGDEAEGKRNDADLHIIRHGLEATVKACGVELKKLEEPDRRSPSAKLSVLIQTHTIIVGTRRRSVDELH